MPAYVMVSSIIQHLHRIISSFLEVRTCQIIHCVDNTVILSNDLLGTEQEEVRQAAASLAVLLGDVKPPDSH